MRINKGLMSAQPGSPWSLHEPLISPILFYSQTMPIPFFLTEILTPSHLRTAGCLTGLSPSSQAEC